jgi:hypothetical protein
MLNLIPWYYRALAVAILFIAAAGWGYVKGLHHQQEIDNEAFAKIRQTQDEQAIKVGKIALDRQTAVSSIVDTYEAQRRDLDARYAKRLRDAQASSHSSAVPANPLPAGVACPAADSGSDPRQSAEFIELASRCADTTLMLVKLQEAVRAVETIK